MKSYLADANFWLALAAEGHRHHQIAAAWFSSLQGGRVYFCRITQMAMLRLLTNPKVVDGQPLTPSEAWILYRALLADPKVGFLPDQTGLEPLWEQLLVHRRSGSDWTDAYLAALAQTGQLHFVTFDAGFRRFANLHLTLLSEKSSQG
jgi:toxin-antitoxin system PIN domain toxin